MVAWPAPAIDRLRALAGAGLSASMIASAIVDELGLPISRNAVLGKIHRLGLSGRRIVTARPHPRSAGRRKPRQNGRHVPPPPLTALPAAQALPVQPAAPDPPGDADIPPPQRRALAELTDATCRWPVGHPGDADFFFCGAPPAAGRPYCCAHMMRATERRPWAR